ncbi:asparagine synthase-related protein [Sphingomonas sp. AR_OL41]|uniref:asparagine synthase-related protein n=1 Tax=Sphingomonas sp. AR_OL41 TaxID=3042729 RepID=UPI0024816193|nr:asparagine synthetase B family protein [Sphingomonas sp. AR_OL41]MDH7974488.1 asparagine synthase-related protein [Sphingomonas sp. AR_OL41]
MSALSYVALLSRQTAARSDRVTAWIERLQREHGLAQLFDSPTLALFGDPALPRLALPAGEGIIIGHVFDRATGTSVSQANPVLRAPAETLVAAIWGGYVALRSRSATPEVMRDPSGMVACYQAAIDDVQIVTSRPDLLFSAGLMRAELDWSVIVQGLAYRDIKATRTALIGIDEILPGTAARLYPTGLETRCVWNPWHFVRPANEAPTWQEAVAAVRATVATCIAAWTGPFSHAIVEISGGLDSAIVAACVAATPIAASGVSYAAIAGDLDETPYARAIAGHIGMPLTLGRPEIAAVDPGLSDAAGLPRPDARCFSQPFDRIARALAEEQHADVFFSGGGGDNVFSYQRSLSPAIDRLRSPGSRRGLWTTIGDLAELGETSVWHVAGRVLRRVLRPPASPWRADRGFLSDAALEDLPFPSGHPWVDIPAHALPGKIMHIAALIRVQGHLEGHRRQRYAPIVSPLLAQPVMEVCLALPSWLWCAGGRNRAIARDAFADRLPPSVIARQSKGAFDSFSAQLFAANRQRLRALLLGGHLASRNLLDLPAIEAVLNSPTASSMPLVALWSLVDTEAWARSWSGGR